MTIAPRWTVAVALAVLTACDPHVRLHAPARESSLDERRSAYLRLRVHMMQTVDVQSSPTDADTLELGDGTVVHHFGDLLPVLDESSAAGRAVRRTVRNERVNTIATVTSAVTGLSGSLLFGRAFISENPSTFEFQVSGALLATAVVTGIVGWYFGRRGRKARVEVFRSYNGSLRERLMVCLDPDPLLLEERVVECDGR